MNQQIKISPVRLIDMDGNQVGVVSIDEARRHAEEAGLDLVEVSPNAKPPVCRIMDYGKYKYEVSKKAKVARKNRHIVHVKEIKMRSEISGHDFDFKMKHAEEFMDRGDKVKFTIMFRGREILHKDHGEAVLNRIKELFEERAAVESNIRLEGRNLSMIMAPK